MILASIRGNLTDCPRNTGGVHSSAFNCFEGFSVLDLTSRDVSPLMMLSQFLGPRVARRAWSPLGLSR